MQCRQSQVRMTGYVFQVTISSQHALSLMALKGRLKEGGKGQGCGRKGGNERERNEGWEGRREGEHWPICWQASGCLAEAVVLFSISWSRLKLTQVSRQGPSSLAAVAKLCKSWAYCWGRCSKQHMRLSFQPRWKEHMFLKSFAWRCVRLDGPGVQQASLRGANLEKTVQAKPLRKRSIIMP